MRFTHILVNNTKTIGNDVETSIGTYFFINKDGWAVSAAHVFNPLMKHRYDIEHIQEIKKLQAQDAAEGRTSTAVMDPNWIDAHSVWFGADQIRLSTLHIIGNQDLAVFKLENLPEGFIQDVAVLGDIGKLKVGTSLCKIGYSFVNIKAEYINNQFKMPNLTSVPPFIMDGIYTRTVTELLQDKKTIMRYIETSSPGILGQSGGPTFDVNGVVYAVQSKTRHLPLGFMPKDMICGEKQHIPQFINLGNGIPIDILIKCLADKGIPFTTENQESDGSVYIIR